MNIQTILPICYIYMLFSTIKLCHYTDYPFIRHILFPPTIVPTDNIPILLHMQNTMQYIFPVLSSIKWKVISLQSSMNRFYNNCILSITPHRFHAVSHRCGDTSFPRSKFFFQRCITHKFIASYAYFSILILFRSQYNRYIFFSVQKT